SRPIRKSLKKPGPLPRSERLRRRTSPGGELGEVVDAQLLLEGGDLLDGLLKALVAEQPVFLLLELLAEFAEPLRRDDLVQGREQHGILASFVRAVHANERRAATDQFLAGSLLAELVGGTAQDHVRHLPPGLVLLPQDLDEIDQLLLLQ